jgi:sulfite exporter TauE/SafE
LGGLLGLIGKSIEINLTFSAILMILVSIVMILLALNMIGLKWLKNFNLSVPKFLTRYISNEKNFKGKYMPFLLGAGTFFLPCGFTVTAQGVALLSGNFWTGMVVMLFFALGTLPMLLLIGYSSVRLMEKKHFGGSFLKIAGVIVLFFGLFNINSGLNVLGLPSFSNLSANLKVDDNENSDLPKIIDGKQVVEMEANASGYKPDYIKVRADIPVLWKIKDTGTSGCTSAILARDFLDKEIKLTSDKTKEVEFTPTKKGSYKFSCWMGMINGVIEVVD